MSTERKSLYAQSLTSLLQSIRGRPLEAEMPRIAPQKYGTEIPLFDEKGRTTMQDVRAEATPNYVSLFVKNCLLFQTPLKVPPSQESLFIQYIQRDAVDIVGISVHSVVIPLHYNLDKMTLEGALREYEQRLIVGALRAAFGNRTKAARTLGMKRTTLVEKLRRWDMITTFEDMKAFSSQGTPSVKYNPNDLISEDWVAYRLGAQPGQISEIVRIKTLFFERLTPAVYISQRQLYRSGDFQESDFQKWGKALADVLSNPYVTERDPQEMITAAHVARELGISLVVAKNRLRSVQPLRGERSGKLYRRGDIHALLHLPGELRRDDNR